MSSSDTTQTSSPTNGSDDQFLPLHTNPLLVVPHCSIVITITTISPRRPVTILLAHTQHHTSPLHPIPRLRYHPILLSLQLRNRMRRQLQFKHARRAAVLASRDPALCRGCRRRRRDLGIAGRGIRGEQFPDGVRPRVKQGLATEIVA